MVEIFNMHKFLYSLNYGGNIKGHKVLFTNRNNEEKEIILDKIEIGTSHISCKLVDNKGNKYQVPFIRIKKVFLKDELVFDNTDIDTSNSKIIKGYD